MADTGKTLCVIPARGGSKRLPGKNIMPIGGKPLIARTIEAARAAAVDRIVVSTDDDAIAAVAAEWGAEVVRRPDDISNDTAPIEESLRHVLRELKKNDGAEFDVVVLLQANIVYRQPGIIDEVARQLRETPERTAVITVIPVTQRPEWMKRTDCGRLIPYMKCEKFRQQELESLYLADGSVIAVRVSTLAATAGRTGVHVYMGENIGYVVNEEIFATEIDRPDDVPRAEMLLRMLDEKK